ncbi:protein disulfide isomerase [Histomonas meleagridis]|uniref:protein disulfide isomerase n=1 Tax=Histomonas meleagridis TaxID=135588 RepID=UPI00355AC09E|nr:protein disulfide isomerase [Histomonas meleagridis]KAH0806052.1 protein disulfide isomerase [Histomonas meleagridis]
MFVVFALGAAAINIPRVQMDSSFIRILDDNTMRDAIRKEKSSFVLFHQDHSKLSDAAYANYVKVAKEYKKKAKFFVVPASVGADVARTYSVPGFPTLFHFLSGTKTGIHHGMFSEDSIRRFISNWTTPNIIELKFKENVTESDVYTAISDAYPDKQLAIILIGDQDTKFERCMNDLAQELGPYFPFVRIADKSVAKTLRVRYPSLMLIRFSDLQKFVYDGEPDADEMFIWTQHNSIPLFRELNTINLFSPDGVSIRSAVAILDTSSSADVDSVYPLLGKYSNTQNWIRFYTADSHKFSSLVTLFNVTTIPSIIYISANYTNISYYVSDISNETIFNQFSNDTLEMATIPTPHGLYGTLRPVTEFAFERMMNEGPFFTLFTSAFCIKCGTLKRAGIDAAKTIARAGGTVNWAFWDVTISTPSFQRDIGLGIPSIWYFPTNNVTEGIQYAGPANYLSVMEWAHGMEQSDFDLDEIMSKEIGGGFDEI